MPRDHPRPTLTPTRLGRSCLHSLLFQFDVIVEHRDSACFAAAKSLFYFDTYPLFPALSALSDTDHLCLNFETLPQFQISRREATEKCQICVPLFPFAAGEADGRMRPPRGEMLRSQTFYRDPWTPIVSSGSLSLPLR